MKCDLCEKELTILEVPYEIKIYKEASPESEVIDIKKICNDCFDDMSTHWVGF
jgi:hypothetical protein